MQKSIKKNIIVLVPRGEAVRNFIYTGILESLANYYTVHLFTVYKSQKLDNEIIQYDFPEEVSHKLHSFVRNILNITHEFYVNSVRHKYGRRIRINRENGFKKFSSLLIHVFSYLLANKNILLYLNKLENYLHIKLSNHFVWRTYIHQINPSFIFNTSHIHGFQSELPCKLSLKFGIPVIGFVFSWDNLTTRSRIVVNYDKLFVWHKQMIELLKIQYSDKHKLFLNAIVTGTPQFDLHSNIISSLSRKDLFNYLNLSEFEIDTKLVLYSTAMSTDFPQEHLILLDLIDWFENDTNIFKSILVIRPYIKGLSNETKELMNNNYRYVRFMPVLWDEFYFTPQIDDIAYYKSILKECHFGINIASTVTLELLIYKKHVINLSFDHELATYPIEYTYKQHLEYDHYINVVKSGSVYVAESSLQLVDLIILLLNLNDENEIGHQFIHEFFDNKLDFKSSSRILSNLI